MAWVTASAPLVAAVRTTKQFLTYVASGPFQYAIAEALALPDTYYTALRDDLRAKRDLLDTGLREAGFTVYEPQGTYFITTDITDLAPGDDALTFCRTLPAKCGVVAVPNSVFYDHPTAGRTQVRFAFCKHHDVLTEAAARLLEFPECSGLFSVLGVLRGGINQDHRCRALPDNDGRSVRPPGTVPPNRLQPPSFRRRRSSQSTGEH